MVTKVDKLAEYVAYFIINLMLFFVGKIFSEISIIQCFLFSLINAIWMGLLLSPLLKKFSAKKEKTDFSKNIHSYISRHEKRQEELKKKFYQEDLEIEEKNKTHKFDWKLFRKYLKDNDIKSLYHFTDKSNLQSIKENNGLYSWKFCENNNIIINKPGGNNLSRHLDVRDNLEDFVRLSFSKNHPMLFSAIKDGRISAPIILEIDIEVIFFQETLFSNKNATKNDARIGNEFYSLEEINLEIINSDYKSLDKNVKDYFQAEILVKSKIESKYIKNLI